MKKIKYLFQKVIQFALKGIFGKYIRICLQRIILVQCTPKVRSITSRLIGKCSQVCNEEGQGVRTWLLFTENVCNPYPNFTMGGYGAIKYIREREL